MRSPCSARTGAKPKNVKFSPIWCVPAGIAGEIAAQLIMIKSLLVLLSVLAPIALILSLWVMAQISRRFGEVTHRPPLYRGFYVAAVLLLFPVGARLLSLGDDTPQYGDTTEILIHDIPLALAITLAIIIAWRYWGWLVYTREEPHSTHK